MTKYKYIVPLIILLFSISITNSSEDGLSIPDHIYLNSESSLPYGYYVAIHRTASENIEIRWEFSGSNIKVGIIGYAMTYAEYFKFQNAQPFNRYYLSDGTHVQDSGTFTPTSSDDWYVVFLNADPYMQATTLTYDVDFIQAPSSLLIMVGILIACIAVGVIIGAIIIVHNKKQKEKLRIQEASQTIIPSSNQDQQEPIKNYNQNIQFCTYCGSPRRIENAYCENCGNKF